MRIFLRPRIGKLYVTQARRAKDRRGVRNGVNGIFSSFAVGVIIGVLGLIFISPLSKLLGSTDTILPYTKQYLFYILCGTPFMMSSLVLNNQLRFQGSAVNGMIGVAAGGVLNILLDPIFIFVFKMGVGGAGCATMLSQAIGFVILLIGCTKKGNIRISFKNFRLKNSSIKKSSVAEFRPLRGRVSRRLPWWL